MALRPDELIKDPIFQVNALLWLVQPLPNDAALQQLGMSCLGIRPLLHMQGFDVYAIAPMLPVPPDVRLDAQAAGLAIRDGARPDVVLHRQRDLKFLLVECKAASFGPNSSAAEQARALMIAAGPRIAEVLGIAPEQAKDALLSYELPETDRSKMVETLESLSAEMLANGLPSGPFSVLGLRSSDTELCVVVDGSAGAFLGIAPDTYVFIRREPGDDPRPLYFIPYDPDVDQSVEERAFCRATLLRRMQSTVVATVGRAIPPTELPFDAKGVLNDAMFGMYGHWESSGARRHMRTLFNHFMGALKESVTAELPGTITFEPGPGWKVKVEDEQAQEALLDALTSFPAETPLSQAKPEPELFDDLADGEGLAPRGT